RSAAGAPDCSCATSAPWVSAAARADLTQIQLDSTSWATPFFRQLTTQTRDARGDARRAGRAVEPVLRTGPVVDRGGGQSASDAERWQRRSSIWRRWAASRSRYPEADAYDTSHAAEAAVWLIRHLRA